MANFIKNNLKEILGIIYIENKFSKASKQDIEYLFLKLKNVFAKQIKNNKWLNVNTKKIAIEKLDKMLSNIGYPNSWNPYTAINFDSTDFFRNTSLIYRIGKEANLKLIDKEIDKSIWTFPVYGIGQSYNTNTNRFTIVAGFLQSPFYSKTMDDAVIYGSIATTIGHEMAHGFDNNGHLYDANGIKINWWTESDSLNFVKATQPLVEQFNNVVVLDSIHINGNLTLGENIADLVGITIAYQAFTSTATFKSNKLINGYTPMQRFFIAYAQRAKEKLSNEAIKWQTTQVWAPQNVRINETLKNFKPFQQAFKVKIGEKMYRSKQFKVY